MNRYKKKTEQKKLSVSFYSKQKVHCPFCKKEFSREEMLSGGGRMQAGELTDELRRIFEPSKKIRSRISDDLFDCGMPNLPCGFVLE